jgi:hypothetical protein
VLHKIIPGILVVEELLAAGNNILVYVPHAEQVVGRKEDEFEGIHESDLAVREDDVWMFNPVE